MSEKKGFLKKLKNTFSSSSKKNEKLIRAAYRAGRRKAQAEKGSLQNDTSSLSASSVNHTTTSSTPGSPSRHANADTGVPGHHHDAAAAAAGAAIGGAGGAAGGAAYSHSRGPSASEQDVIRQTGRGKVRSTPPKIPRQPYEKDPAGDYANEKTPLEVTGGHGHDGEPATIENTNPRYENSATPVQGHGAFYDPRDTQGGLYRHLGDDYNSAGSPGAGAGAAAGAADISQSAQQGKGADRYTEATQAELERQRNLKTKPSAYAQQDKANKQIDDITNRAYQQGQLHAHQTYQQGQQVARLAADLGSVSGVGNAALVDPSAEHSKNKSAYNKGGVSQALEEASKSPSSSVRGAKSPSSSVRGAPSSGIGAAGAGAAGGAAGAGIGGAVGSSLDKNTSSDARSNVYNAGQPPSSSDFDYDTEIKRLDQNINKTQKEIDGLSPTLDPKAGQTKSGQFESGPSATSKSASAQSGKSATSAYSGQSGSQSKPATEYSSGNKGTLAGAGSGAAVGAGAGAAVGGAAGAAIGGVGGAAAGGAGGAKILGSDSYGEAAASGLEEYYRAGVAKGAYDAGHTEAYKDHAYRAGQTKAAYDAGHQAAKDDGATAPIGQSSSQLSGLLAGAAGAVGAVAGAIFGSSSKSKKDNNTGTDADPVNKTSKEASTDRTLDPNADGPEDPNDSGVLDSAKGAIASVGATAAGAFGYEGYNRYYNTDNKDVGEYEGFEEPTHREQGLPENEGIAASSTGQKHNVSNPYGLNPPTTETRSAGSSAANANELAGSTAPAPTSVSANDDSQSQNSGGLWSRLGFGGSDNKSAKSASSDKPEKPTLDDLNDDEDELDDEVPKSKSAVSGSKGDSVQEKNKTDYHPTDSLVAEAGDDVNKLPAHKGQENVLKGETTASGEGHSDGVQDVPGLVPDNSSGETSKKDDSSKDVKYTEDSVADYNKNQGFTNDKRSLVQIAEENDPLIKDLHHAEGLHDANELGDKSEEGVPRPGAGAAGTGQHARHRTAP